MVREESTTNDAHFEPWAWIADQVGTPTAREACQTPLAPNRVWRLRFGTRPSLFVKVFSSRAKCRQERDALKRWAPALRREDLSTPEIVAAEPEERALLLSGLPGVSASAAAGSEHDAARWHHRMAAACRTLHELPLKETDLDPLPLARAIPERLASWLRRAGDRLSTAERETARRLVGDGSLFEGDSRVPCHRDFQPRNWLIDRRHEGSETYGLIDFEHARPDHPLVDFVRVAERATPGIFEAFLDGYGIDRASIDGKLRAISAIHAIGSVVWGDEHGDAEFSAEGHRLLERLHSEP